MPPQTVLVLGSTGHIGISAIHGALSNGKNIIAVSWKQMCFPTSVQGVVDKVREGALPGFQHVFSAIGGSYGGESLLEIETDTLRNVMTQNFESNFFAYRATIPYLLSQPDSKSTWTICTGAQGDVGERALPAMTQGALFSFCISAEKALAGTNVRFTELYLAARVEVDSSAERSGVMKASVFGRVYERVLASSEICGRVRVYGEEDVEDLKMGRASDVVGFTSRWVPEA